MYKSTRLGGGGSVDGAKSSLLGYVETDPSARYGRFKEVLGKGAIKTVYRAFDKVLGMEVAWNQVKLNDVFRSPEELQRLYSEVHLLKNLNHDSIIKFHASWIDIDRRTFNFITEMFTSGTLREYKQKYPHVDIRAIKNWARQILHGLVYLHGHEPPVIHRDLKCDNIFVNGHLGQVKIGDLGFAAMLRGSQHAHSVIGTPEFMAPELYEETYDELVDVYSFGMCMLEMLTSEYPYSECSNPAQIYKKVTSGKLPAAFYKIKDAGAQEFVGKCLVNVSERLPAKDLLLDPFLASDEGEPRIPQVPFQNSNTSVEEILPSLLADRAETTDMTITGTMNSEGDTIFLKVQMSDKDGRGRNIYFPFDIKNDTAIDVAVEMVKELEINDLEPLEIAEMIEEEILSLIPNWKRWDLSEIHPQQHSFSYEDDDEDIGNGINHPFYATSSRSSSQTSLLAFNSHFESHLCCGAHSTCCLTPCQGDIFINEDASSESSYNSFKYSNLNYYSGNEDDNRRPQSLARSSSRNSTRQGQHVQLDAFECRSSKPQRKLSRIQSLVDVRSQLLHRSLMEQIQKKRQFKTVGAVENIGFHEPRLPNNRYY